MSYLAPAVPPELGGADSGDGAPPLSPPALSPENDDVIPLPPIVLIPPTSSPPQSSGVIPLPLAPQPLLPPLLPSPILSPPPIPPPPVLSPPQPLPLPTLTPTNPPKIEPNPPSIPPRVNKPSPMPPSIKPNPATRTKPSPPLEKPPQRAAPIRARPEPTGSYKSDPSRPKHTIPSISAPQPTSSLPTAILPSPPPMALPVPQTPGGGAWMPFTSETPAPLPILPGPPGRGVVNSPATPLLGSSSGTSSSSSSSRGGDHQNIEASVGSSSGRSSTGSNTIVVGLCVGGVMLLLLGVVFAILVVFCKRRKEKRFDEYKSGKHGASFDGFEEKTSLPQYTKQGSASLGNQLMITHKPTITSNGSNHGSGHTMAVASPITGRATSFSSGTLTYDELSRATNGFSEGNLLGQGGFGYVHKGVLPNGKEVAVKQLKMGGDQGEREFQAEVETISQVHHKHLVSLVGYCIAGVERLLVYEFVPNNTLEFHLHGKGQPVMDWSTRLRIAIGSAKGLAYLHEDCSPTIIHRDIKASNILLDYNFEAKVSDFGLAKIFTGTNSSITHMTTRVVGTFGYLAPEYASSGKVTDKSDVYSYGVMLLELITGRPPICNFESATNGSLVNWARPLLTQAIGDRNFDTLADPRMQKNYDVDDMANMVACAAACVRLTAWRRPRMSQVVRALEGNLSASELDDGTRPGQGDSSMQFPYESLGFDVHNYMEDLKRMALTNNNGYATSRYSDNTSDYGLHPSASSTETASQYSGQRG